MSMYCGESKVNKLCRPYVNIGEHKPRIFIISHHKTNLRHLIDQSFQPFLSGASQGRLCGSSRSNRDTNIWGLEIIFRCTLLLPYQTIFCIFRVNLPANLTRSYFLLAISYPANPLLVIPPVLSEELSVIGGAMPDLLLTTYFGTVNCKKTSEEY